MVRVFDVFLSFVAILILIPLLLPLCFLLRMTGEGEIFYSQERVGQNGRPFKLLKFATMLKLSPQIGSGTITVHNDPRVLPVGRFLRKTKINELPQIINVLRGEMSIVGPRPLTKETFLAYPSNLQVLVLEVRPGLSGMGSIVFRNEEAILSGSRSTVDFYTDVIAPYKGELEAWYSRNNSLTNYFKIIIVTVLVLIFPKAGLPWRIFSGLPKPPTELRDQLFVG
jgi:lipopolysaccharide/colanic/teichoic acid biosynthesis glycosyltransferase